VECIFNSHPNPPPSPRRARDLRQGEGILVGESFGPVYLNSFNFLNYLNFVYLNFFNFFNCLNFLLFIMTGVVILIFVNVVFVIVPVLLLIEHVENHAGNLGIHSLELPYPPSNLF